MNIPSGTKILTIDDDAFLRESIATYLEDSEFQVIQAENGRIGLEKFRSSNPDVVLLDLRMPEMDGLELLPILAEENNEIPVIIVSGMGTMQDSIEALRLGAWDYITKPIHDMAFLEHAIGRALERAQMMRELRQYQEGLETLVSERTTELRQQHSLLQSLINSIPDLIYLKDGEGKYMGCNRAFEEYAGVKEGQLIGQNDSSLFSDSPTQIQKSRESEILELEKSVHTEQILDYPDGRKVPVETLKTPFYDESGLPRGVIGISRDITERMQAEEERKAHTEQLQHSLVQTIEAVAIAMEKRDPYTAGHQERVADIAEKIAQGMSLEENQIEGLRLGATIHDIGKIYIPAEILTRPGRISDTEYEIIKTHSQVGWEIMKDISFPWPVKEMILQHHERLDGSGYPHGIKGDEIILEARILAVADVLEAMASHRPYRAGLGLDAACDELRDGSGSIYDEQVVNTCIKLIDNKLIDL